MAPDAAICGKQCGRFSPLARDDGTIYGMAEPQVFYYGDNLKVMREWLGDESIDMIYLDPPFNSKRNYNQVFRETDGTPSNAQVGVMEDYWRWGPEAAAAYEEIVIAPPKRHLVPARLSRTLEMLRETLKHTDILAYIAMMAPRLVEMRRVMKQTASLFLHCDPVVSHYMKIVLDALFEPQNFRNEIIWRRSAAKGDAVRKFGSNHDVILCYGKDTPETYFTPVRRDTDEAYLANFRFDDKDGRGPYRLAPMDSPNPRPNLTYPYKGFPPPKKGWRVSPKLMRELDEDGRLAFPSKPDGRIQKKHYLWERELPTIGDTWTDIAPLQDKSREKVGFPTQKPLELLERIIDASCPLGGLVLDPFCGCGTTVEAAQKLGRKWIGIDVTHVAVSVLRRRLERDFPGLVYKIRGEPEDAASARTLANSKPKGRFEFQAWIVDKVGGVPVDSPKEKGVANQGGDGGVDGWYMFRDDPRAERSKRVVLSVKSDKTLDPGMIRDLIGTVEGEKAAAGALLLLEEPTPGMVERARKAGRFSSDVFDPDVKYDRIQILSVQDIFAGKTLKFPGWNSSRKSEPPPGTADATLEMFEHRKKIRPPKKVAAEKVPEEQIELPKSSRRR